MNKELLIWFYEQQQTYVPLEKITQKFGNNAKQMINQCQTYLEVSNQGLSLKPRYVIGILDVKRTIAFLLQPGNDLKLEYRDLAEALDKDLVIVEKFARFNKVVAIIKRHLTQLIAQVRITKSYVRFTVDNDHGKFINVNQYPNHLVDGHIVLLDVDEISEYNIHCRFNKIIGHKNDPDIDIVKIVYGYNWPLSFSEEVLSEVDQLSVDVEYEKSTRKDMTNQLVVTIDGEDAKDLDDAISVSKINDNYQVSVHIADVSYFVKEGSQLEISAYERATSVYLADRVIPMIPHGLSNDLCSLNPHTLKYTMSCDITLSANLEVIDYSIYPSIIESKQRLTYKQVNDLIYHNISVGSKEIDQMLLIANELGLKLKQQRTKRGAIDFHSSELKFEIDPETNKVLDVIERHTDQAEGLIESFMILANEVVATHFVKNNLPGIYRVHERPDDDKLAKALDTVAKLGFYSNSQDVTKVLQVLTKNSMTTDYEYVVNMLLLKAMSKAKYYEKPIGHFGLASKYYSHFTSPIRRYPDLILHRMIRQLIFNKSPKKVQTYFSSIMHSVCEHTSLQERKAVHMERDVAALKSADFMQDKIGLTFEAIIVSMSQSGFFIKLNNGIEGFVPLRALSQYLAYDETQLSFMNHQGKTYKLGQKVIVELIQVDKMKREITFVLEGMKGVVNEDSNPKQKSQSRLSNISENRGRHSIKGKRSKVNQKRKNQH